MGIHISTVHLDADGEVKSLRVMADRAEYEWITETKAPDVLAFPTGMHITAAVAAEVFHRAGNIPGNHPDHEASNNVYYSFARIVDTLIEGN